MAGGKQKSFGDLPKDNYGSSLSNVHPGRRAVSDSSIPRAQDHESTSPLDDPHRDDNFHPYIVHNNGIQTPMSEIYATLDDLRRRPTFAYLQPIKLKTPETAPPNLDKTPIKYPAIPCLKTTPEVIRATIREENLSFSPTAFSTVESPSPYQLLREQNFMPLPPFKAGRAGRSRVKKTSSVGKCRGISKSPRKTGKKGSSVTQLEPACQGILSHIYGYSKIVDLYCYLTMKPPNGTGADGL